MGSFYSTLYSRFAALQADQSFSARFVYPAGGPLPFLKAGKAISGCMVGIPPVQAANGTISYGPFVFEDNDSTQAAAVKLAVASTCLLSGKSVFHWLYRDYLNEWLATKADALRAGYAANVIFDALARQRIRQVEGEDFYADVMGAADMVAAAMLPRKTNDFSVLAQSTIASLLLNAPAYAPAPVLKIARDFMSKLGTLTFKPSRLVDVIRDRASAGGAVQLDRRESGWDQLGALADGLYSIIARIPGKWRSVYLPYSHALAGGVSSSVFQSRLITGEEFDGIRRHAKKQGNNSNDALWQEIFFELQREEKKKEKTLSRLSNAVEDLNFAGTGFPMNDYVSYHRLYAELAPQIRRMIERVRMVKNVQDENTFEETGNIDLQVAIQAIASETARSDIFVKDENLLKNESWTILVDSSQSLGGSSREVKAVSICLAETAREIMGASPWGMFAFSDELYCIKDFSEPYGHHIKARVGGLTQSGLSHIPDAIRACRIMAAEHLQDRNYMILVSDGLPSGYPGIEQEFAASVKELGKSGINLAAIGIVGGSIKKTVRNAKIIQEPAEIVKEFMEIYYGLSA